MEQYIDYVEFPTLLKEIADAPNGLYCYGDVGLLNTKCVSIVGSRTPELQTLDALQHIVPKLVKMGYTIVSGCATGVDAEAHKIAIKAGGRCIGVLGYGCNLRYPKSSKLLIDFLMKKGLILSEYEATTPIRKFQFIARNRIIAALSSTTVILQAASKSGSLITAQMALEYNREVLIVPGTPFSGTYTGCHQLISEGAQILYSTEQLTKKSGLF